MKTVQVIGENLHENLLVAVTSDPNNPAESFAIRIKFIENGQIQNERLVIHQKEPTFNKSTDEYILTFVGTLVEGNPKRHCIGYFYTVGAVHECWITIVTPPEKTLTIDISKSDFVQKCKEYAKSIGCKNIDEGGNNTDGLSLFSNVPEPGGPTGEIRMNKNIIIHTELYNNLFPIEKDGKTIFGEYIDEHVIRVCSQNEAILRGVVASE